MIKRKLTLEQRISRLEKILNSNRKSRKFESFESALDEAGARAKANQIANQFGALVGADIEPDDLNLILFQDEQCVVQV